MLENIYENKHRTISLAFETYQDDGYVLSLNLSTQQISRFIYPTDPSTLCLLHSPLLALHYHHVWSRPDRRLLAVDGYSTLSRCSFETAVASCATASSRLHGRSLAATDSDILEHMRNVTWSGTETACPHFKTYQGRNWRDSNCGSQDTRATVPHIQPATVRHRQHLLPDVNRSIPSKHAASARRHVQSPVRLRHTSERTRGLGERCPLTSHVPGGCYCTNRGDTCPSDFLSHVQR